MYTTRRQFLNSVSAATTLSLAAPALSLFSRAANANPVGDVLLCIFQRGGADGLNMVVPYADADYYSWRPQLAIAAAGQQDGVIDLDGFFGLHPALAPLKAIYDAGDLAAVHATGSPHDTRSHFDAQDFMERAHLQKGGIFSGWLGRHLESISAANPAALAPFSALGLGVAAQKSLRGEGAVIPVAINGIETFAINSQDQALPIYLNALYDDGDFLSSQAQQTVATVDLIAAQNPSQYLPDNNAVYPDGEFGQLLMQAGQLIKTQALGVEVICVDIGGWDTHDQQPQRLTALCDDFAHSLAAFYTDMGARMANITVVTMSEFGRRVYENASLGTDHGHGNIMLLLGGGVNGAKVYADWPGLAPSQLYGNGDLQVTTDWRTVLAELVSKRLLNEDLAAVFPEFTVPAWMEIFQQG